MFEGREYLVSQSKYLRLNLEVPHEEILQEAKNLREKFVPYRTDEYSHKGWYSLPIIGLSSSDPYSWDNYNYASAKQAAPDMKWTNICQYCPITVKWLKEVYPSSSYGRVRFMLLESGGEIGFHRDTKYSILGAVNVALNNPKGCSWYWKDGSSLQFNPGESYTMNISYEHSVRNDSDEDRYHLIIHHYDSTVEYKNMLKESMEKYEVQGDFHYSTELF